MDEVPLDKRRKIGTGRMLGTRGVGRGRQAFAAINNQQDLGAPSGMTSTEGPECGTIVFTKEEVEALLNEKIKAKKFDTKVVLIFQDCNLILHFACFHGLPVNFEYLFLQGKMEQMDGHIKKLKLCIKWFQQHEEGQLVEQGKLQNALECAEKKCADTGKSDTFVLFI